MSWEHTRRRFEDHAGDFLGDVVQDEEHGMPRVEVDASFGVSSCAELRELIEHLKKCADWLEERTKEAARRYGR